MDPFELLAIDLLDHRHPIRFQAHGSSMRPFILDGESIEVQPLSHPVIKVGDIVFYQLSSGRFLIHRVLQVNDNKLLIQGDANLFPDGWIDCDRVLGKAGALYRKGKRIDFSSAWWISSGLVWVMLTPLRCRLQPTLQAIWRRFRARLEHK